MKIRYLVVLTCLIGAGAQADDMVVYRWDDVCNYSTSTNWFSVAPGQSATIEVDLTGCTEEQIGSLLFFGNYAARNSGKQLSSRHKVRLHLTALYSSGNVAGQMTSDSGSILADVAHLDAPTCILTAENTNRNKTVTIRLRAHLFEAAP
ncbi:MAG: hypothetical protein OER97_04120 [Gammaproteobacteria bacterium]|nr:hypothetical protein [Gammaproteobacteria bacterium]